ncbi:MAG: gliding motility-associated C-terminal domain-containing protein [Cryomorphaceae bacterium]|nr:gliding motility-associated C-terminal domain-containing protein [Cryomorphaceae bacterium]
MGTAFSLVGQDLPGSGNASGPFDPGYVEIQDFPRLQFPFTIMAWVRIPATSNMGIYPIFSTGQGIPAAFRGVSFGVQRLGATGNFVRLTFEFGDGSSYNFANVRSCFQTINANLINADRMIHVAVRATNANNIQFFINGTLQGGFCNGGASVTQPGYPPIIQANNARIGSHQRQNNELFNGDIDEISVWESALTDQQIRTFMCRKIPPATNNLLAYYKLDELNATDTIVDSSTNNYFGLPVGSVPKILSEAAIGDESTFIYPSPFNGVLQHISSTGDTVTTSAIPPNLTGTTGIHIYTVLDTPNTFNSMGDDSLCLPGHYHGVYLARVSSFTGPNLPPNFQRVNVTINGPTSPYFGKYIRGRNDSPTWFLQAPPTSIGNSVETDVPFRREIITRQESFDYDPNMPADFVTCNYPDTILVNDFPQGNLNWSGPSGGSTGSQLIINGPGTYTLTADGFCSNTPQTYSITVDPDTIRLDTTLTFCEGDSVVFFDTIVFTDTPFQYTRDSAACDTIYSVSINYSNETIPRDTSAVLCRGESFAHGNNVFTEEGTFNYIINNPNGCDFEYTVDIVVLEDPEIFLDFEDNQLCDGDELQLRVLNIGDGDVLWNTNETSSTIIVTQAGVYAVEVTGDCGVQSESVQIEVINCLPRLFIPSAFTPNGDGRNDVFLVKGSTVASFTMYIYDRWGNEVFSTNTIDEGWDGNINGQPAPMGVYVYSIIATGFETEDILRERGSISLIR